MTALATAVLVVFAASSAFLAGLAVMLAVQYAPRPRRRGFDVVKDAIDDH